MPALSATLGRFRPRLGPTLTAVVGHRGAGRLGTWQLQRLAWKEDLIATRRGAHQRPGRRRAPRGRRSARRSTSATSAAGAASCSDRAFGFGFSRADGDEPGGELVTPLRLDDGRVLLVDRGWLPEATAAAARPADLRAGRARSTSRACAR